MHHTELGFLGAGDAVAELHRLRLCLEVLARLPELDPSTPLKSIHLWLEAVRSELDARREEPVGVEAQHDGAVGMDVDPGDEARQSRALLGEAPVEQSPIADDDFLHRQIGRQRRQDARSRAGELTLDGIVVVHRAIEIADEQLARAARDSHCLSQLLDRCSKPGAARLERTHDVHLRSVGAPDARVVSRDELLELRRIFRERLDDLADPRLELRARHIRPIRAPADART